LAAVAAPLTPLQTLEVKAFIGTIDWFHFPPNDWNQAPDDGWLGNDYVWQWRTGGYFPQWGFIDETGIIVIPLRFSRVRSFREGLAYAAKDKISGFIDRSGQWVIQSKDNRFIGDFSEGLARFRKSGKEGCIDKKGNVIIPPKFHSLHDFSYGRAAFTTKDGNHGFIDKTGKIVVEARYKNVRSFSEGLAAAWLNTRWGYLDRSGKAAIPFQYEQAMGFSGGLAAVCVDGKWGYIDKKGKMVIAPQFAGASVFRDDRARVNIGGNYYFHPFYRRELGSGEYYWVVNGYWRYIDKSGEFISDMKFDDALDFRDGLAAFKIFRKYGLKDSDGRIIFPAQYDEIGRKFISGMAKVRSKGRWGFINDSGRVTVRPAFDEVRNFAQGPAAVRVGKRWGHVSRDGKLAIKPQFDNALSFSEERTAVLFPPAGNRKDAKWRYIDITGKTVLQPVFQDARSFNESMAAVCVGDKYGYIDKSGKMVIPPRFRDARDFSRGLAVVCRMNLTGPYDFFWGVIDKQGKYVIPAVFPTEPKVEKGMYVFEIYYEDVDDPAEVMVNQHGLVYEGDKVLGTVSEYFLPSLLEAVGDKDQDLVRHTLCVLSGLPGPKALKPIRKSIESPDVYTRILGAKALGQATGQDPLDILLKQLASARTQAADRANEAVMLLIIDRPTAVVVLGKSSTVPEKYRKQLIRRAVMEIEIGPHVQKSWRSKTVQFEFDNEKLSDVIESVRNFTGSSIFVDWRGLANVSIKPTTTIDLQVPRTAIYLQVPRTTMNLAWDKMLFTSLRGAKVDSIVIGGVTVVSTRDRLGPIASALSARPSVGLKKPEKNRAVKKLLQANLPKVDFYDIELSQVLQFYRDVSGAKIEIDFTALAPLGVGPKTTVNVHLGNTTFDTALKLILVSAAGPRKVVYRIHDGKILITRAPKADNPPKPDPVAVLTGALKHKDKEVRDAAAEALKRIRSERSNSPTIPPRGR